MKLLLSVVLLFVLSAFSFAQSCVETAKIVPPVISDNAKRVYQTKLAEAKAEHEKAPGAESLIWLGRRIAYLGDYKESIRVFGEGVKKYPTDARFYRHRGHRLISIRCFDDAIRDFESAAKLTKGKPDQIEPDGLPNARNIPTSTLQSNIYYHLGLAHYLKGDFKKALKAYRECLKVSKNNDMSVATIHWLYMTLRRLKDEKEAAKAIAAVADDLEIIENDDYYKLIKLYQGKVKPEELLKADADSLGNVSLGYGIGNWYLYNGNRDAAAKVFRQITAGNQWASFGFIAAEAELRRF